MNSQITKMKHIGHGVLLPLKLYLRIIQRSSSTNTPSVFCKNLIRAMWKQNVRHRFLKETDEIKSKNVKRRLKNKPLRTKATPSKVKALRCKYFI